MASLQNAQPVNRGHPVTVHSFIYIFLGLLSLICLGPFLIVFINATRSDTQIVSSFTLFPGSSIVDNWLVMDSRIHFMRSFLNSAFIAISCTTLACYFGSLCGYSLARLKFKGSKVIFSLVLLTLIVPWQIGIIGFFDLMNSYRMLDTYWPLIIPSIGNSGMVFFTKQYIEGSIPTDLLEAARMEGAGEIRIFHSIIFPIASPSIFTMGILTFIGHWNSYLTPFIILISNEKFTLPLTLGLINNPNEFHPGATYLLLAISVGVAVVIFLSLSKYIFRALNEGSIKS
jgi:multiple sugar transport system permease protein